MEEKTYCYYCKYGSIDCIEYSCPNEDMTVEGVPLFVYLAKHPELTQEEDNG